MRYLIPLLALAALGGCKKDFYEIDAACHDKVPGSKKITATEAIDMVHRTNCYRRLVKLNRGRLDPKVQEGIENHLAYMVTNRSWETGGDWRIEDPTLPGFTGVDIYERMEAVEYVFEDVQGWGLWEITAVDHPFTPDELVDYLLPDPFWRQVFLQPSWVDSGYAEQLTDAGEIVSYGTVFYSYPSSEREGRPIVYPRDGQLDVPYAYQSDNPLDSIYPLGQVGLPITLTFSNSMPGAFDPTAVNPYGVTWESASLSSGEGPVELQLITPPGNSDVDLLRYTLVAVPLEPLAPGTEYTFTADVSWAPDFRKTITSTFTTSGSPDFRGEWQGAFTARSAGRLHLRHQRLLPQ